jgi:hypothetical protein
VVVALLVSGPGVADAEVPGVTDCGGAPRSQAGQGVNGYSHRLVQAYKARTGTLRWKGRFDNAVSLAIAQEAALSGGRLFGVADVQTHTHFSDLVIMAYDTQ